MYFNPFYTDLQIGTLYLLLHTAVIRQFSSTYIVVDIEENHIPVEIFTGFHSSNFIMCLN